MTVNKDGRKTGGDSGKTKAVCGQMIKRPTTAIRKKPKHTFADGIKSLLKAITKMM